MQCLCSSLQRIDNCADPRSCSNIASFVNLQRDVYWPISCQNMQSSIQHCFCEQAQVLSDINFFMSPRPVCKPESARKLVTDFTEGLDCCRPLLNNVLDCDTRAFRNIYALK